MITKKNLHKIVSVWHNDYTVRGFFHRVINTYDLTSDMIKKMEEIVMEYQMGLVCHRDFVNMMLDVYAFTYGKVMCGNITLSIG